MFKKLQTIYQLKKIKQKKINEDFLSSLRIDLVNFTKSEPAVHKTISFNKNPFILLQPKFAIALIVAIIAVFGGSGLTLASQNSLPREALYPIKLFSETVRSALTVSPEAKEKLALDSASRRIEEIKTIMEKKDVDPRGINIAISSLEKNITKANNIVNREKEKNKDAGIRASSTDADSNNQEQELHKIFKDQKIELRNRAKDLGDKNNIKSELHAKQAEETLKKIENAIKKTENDNENENNDNRKEVKGEKIKNNMK